MKEGVNILSKKEKDDLKLLFIPEGNWKYCYDSQLNCVWAIAVNKQCKDCIFGNIKYFRDWLKKEIEKNENLTGSLTALGFKVLNKGEI